MRFVRILQAAGLDLPRWIGGYRSEPMYKFRSFSGLSLAAVIFLNVPVAGANGEELVVGNFSDGDMTGWKTLNYERETDYQLNVEGGTRVLTATSNGSASQMYFQIDLDLRDFPFIEWRWRVDDLLDINDETTRDGDDFPVRIYVGSMLGGEFHSLCYVWSGTGEVGESWPNPFRDSVTMIAVDAGDQYLGEWRTHRRDIASDFLVHAGLEIDGIIGIGLMTDSDNSGQSANGSYGDIRLLPE